MPTKAGGQTRVFASLWALSFYFCIYRLDSLLLSGLLGGFSAVTKKKKKSPQKSTASNMHDNLVCMWVNVELQILVLGELICR